MHGSCYAGDVVATVAGGRRRASVEQCVLGKMVIWPLIKKQTTVMAMLHTRSRRCILTVDRLMEGWEVILAP
jgi:hypothetical protein